MSTSHQRELQQKLAAKQADIDAIFDEARTADGGLDFERVKSLPGANSAAKVSERVRALIDEYEFLGAQLHAGDDDDMSRRHPGHPSGVKSIGARVSAHEGFKSWVKAGASGVWSEDFKVLPSEYLGVKTLMTTSAGWAPFSPRSDVVVDAVTRPIQLLDIVPGRDTGAAKVVFMREDTRTHSAAETAEGGTYPESTFVLSEQSEDVKKIADSLPVTDEQLEDEQMAQAYIDGRLRFGVRQRLDNQILNGDGTGSNLTGILNAGGIQTQAKGADPAFDAVRKAVTKVQVTGRAAPTHVVIHPNDLEALELTRTADGEYVLRMPGQPGADGRLWSLPVVPSDAIAAGTALVGSFMEPWITLWERRGVIVEVGFVGTQFVEGKKTVRATGRWALVVGRPAAFATVTGL